ncbi:MAG: hypothetical protein ABW079_17195 [Sedimenticola sp.]
MTRRFAVKLLGHSDLTSFKDYNDNSTGTNQKAINLNTDVFTGQFFPDLPKDREIPVAVNAYGPGGRDCHVYAEQIYHPQKNWRLGDKLIPGPGGDERRYADMAEGDFAVISFEGDDEPNGVSILFIGEGYPEDGSLHSVFVDKFGMKPRVDSMRAVDVDTLIDLASEADIAEDHSFYTFIDESDLEDAVLGGGDGLINLRKRRKGKGITREEFEKARKRAERNGQLGEELLDQHFGLLVQSGEIPGYKWVARTDPYGPFDFTINDGDEELRKLDAKSTDGPFENRIHLSLGELVEMANSKVPYDIYRLYSMTEETAKLRISKDSGSFARSILGKVQDLPEGVSIKGISLEPGVMTFGEEQFVDLRTEPDLFGT